jgi:hypothetical protein
VSDFALIDAACLPESPLDAAAEFFASIVPQARAALAASDVVIAFSSADHAHAAWRLAAVQELAREAAPHRVNAVAGPAGAGQAAVLAYLGRAPGVTGQVLQVDGNSAQSG